MCVYVLMCVYSLLVVKFVQMFKVITVKPSSDTTAGNIRFTSTYQRFVYSKRTKLQGNCTTDIVELLYN